MYDFEKLFDDYGVDYKPLNSRGYISIPCPFCSDSKYKLGIHISGFAVCWSCGSHAIWTVIKHFTGQNWSDIQTQYKTTLNSRDLYLLNNRSEDRIIPSKLSLPEYTEPLNDRAKKYLESRGFDIQELIDVYDIRSTGHLGNYCFRIVIPIYFEGKIVSWTTRDYSGKASVRYMSCPTSQEIIPHKDIVYGYDLVPGTHAVCCEGPMDAIKMGPGAVATFGIAFRSSQINLLASFMKVTLLYDSSDDAQKAADNLGNQLSGLGVEVESIVLKEYKDPGEIPLDEARQLMKEILDEKRN